MILYKNYNTIYCKTDIKSTLKNKLKPTAQQIFIC